MGRVTRQWGLTVVKKLAFTVYRLRLRLHRRFRWLPHPDDRRSDIRSWGIDELAENAATGLPGGAAFGVTCVWTVEYFTPSNVAKLHQAVERLGLTPFDDSEVYRDPRDWLKAARSSSSHGSGWHHLGSIKRKRGIFAGGMAAVGPVPKQFDYIEAYVHHISPSLSACVLMFALREPFINKISAELARFRFSKFVSYGHSFSRLGPKEIKKNAISQYRLSLRLAAHDWCSEHLPGFFSSFKHDDRPVVEFDFHKSFSRILHSDVPEVVGLDGWSLKWQMESRYDIQLVMPRFGKIEKMPHALLVGSYENIERVADERYSNMALRAAVDINHDVRKFVAQWGVLSLLASMRQRISILRDNELGVSDRDPWTAIRQLKEMTAQSAEIETVCADIVSMGEKRPIPGYPVFVGLQDMRKEAKENFLTWVNIQASSQAKSILRLEHSVRKLAQQKGTLIVAEQNLRLQLIVGLLTAVATAVAAVSALSSASNLEEGAKGLLEAFIAAARSVSDRIPQ